jgi:basic membrane protein A
VVSIAALTLVGCGDRPDDEADDSSASDSASESASAEPIDFKACMVSDSGGFNDKSFNQTSHDGLMNAATNLGVQTGEVESQSDTEYADNINALVQEGCNSITTVGFLLGEATETAAKKNKDIDCSIVDFAYEKPPANLQGLIFNTAEPSFLAGYLAAAKSESGTVGTFGGLNIPTVTSFMTGFTQGVDYYNTENDTDVQVIGWDAKKGEGSFTEDFEHKTKGQAVTEQMIQQGADIIFPVAGPAGLGGLQAAKDAGKWGIWVDTDGCVSAAEYCDVLLTSVMKGMDVAVEESIRQSVDGEFSNAPYVGTLENEGVGLADFGPNADVDDELAAKIEELKGMIVSGEIKVG